jgi:hypothetical protein
MALVRETTAGAILACVILLGAPVGASGSVSEGEEILCEGDSCQSLPPEPEDPTPGTLVPNPGNPPLHVSEPRRKHKPSKKRRNGHRSSGQKHGKGGHARGLNR